MLIWDFCIIYTRVTSATVCENGPSRQIQGVAKCLQALSDAFAPLQATQPVTWRMHSTDFAPRQEEVFASYLPHSTSCGT